MSHTDKGGVYMATSSITKNFVISGQKQVEMFADAIEASFNIREYLGDGSHGLGEDTLIQVLSEFSCKIN